MTAALVPDTAPAPDKTPAHTLRQPVRTAAPACAVFGWSYWADSPHPGCVWAVTPEQTYRLVKIRVRGEVCEAAIAGQTTDRGLLLYTPKSLEWHRFERLPRGITSAVL